MSFLDSVFVVYVMPHEWGAALLLMCIRLNELTWISGISRRNITQWTHVCSSLYLEATDLTCWRMPCLEEPCSCVSVQCQRFSSTFDIVSLHLLTSPCLRWRIDRLSRLACTALITRALMRLNSRNKIQCLKKKSWGYSNKLTMIKCFLKILFWPN